MSLRGSTLDVPLQAQNQQSPTTSAAMGEILRLNNGICTKFKSGGDNPQSLKVEKRTGFQSLATSHSDPTTGGPRLDLTLSQTTLLSTFQKQLVAISNGMPRVLAEDVPVWEAFVNNTVHTNRLTQSDVFTEDSVCEAPDGAAVGQISFYTWRTQDGACYGKMVDSDGTPLLVPFQIGTGSGRAKVVSDGSLFWVFHDNASTSVFVVAYAPDGTAPVTGTVATLDAATDTWDIHWDSTFGLGLVQPHSGIAIVSKIVRAGAGVTVTTRNINMLTGGTGASGGVSWLTSNGFDGYAYIATVQTDGDGSGQHVYAYKIDAINSNFAAIIDSWDFGGLTVTANPVVNISGYGDSGNCWVAYSQVPFGLPGYPTAPNQMGGWTMVWQGVPGAQGAIGTLKRQWYEVSVGSRAFTVDGFWSVVLYYPSQNISAFAARASNNKVSQPTYFIADMAQCSVVGRFQYGSAAMDYTVRNLGASPNYIGRGVFSLPSPFLIGTGDLHLPMAYNARTYRTQHNIETVDRKHPFTSVQVFPLIQQVNSVGIKDYKILQTINSLHPIGLVHGQALEYAGEMFIPGLQATSFTGSAFSENGVNLAPEQPTFGADGTTGSLTAGVEYAYYVVFEQTLNNGDRIRSAATAPSFHTLATGKNAIVLNGYNMTVTQRPRVTIAIYRTFMTNGVMSQQLRKVSTDLTPLLNDPTTATWTFTDTMSDENCSIQEPFYGALDPNAPSILFHDPCPAFSTGCVFQNRLFVVGDDGMIHYSNEKVKGDALSFPGELFIQMPTSDPITNLVGLDNRLLIMCQNSMWFMNGSGWPDANGQNGSLQVPQKLPFTNGSTGFAKLVKEGVMYASSMGGCWLVTRELTNTQVGSRAIDDFSGQLISGIDVDANQRAFVSVSNSPQVNVWDPVAGIWSLFSTLPTSVTDIPVGYATIITIWQNALVYYDGDVKFWKQSAENYFDDVSSPIVTTLQILPVHFRGVKNLKRVWKIQFAGEYVGDHDLQVVIDYDDYGRQIQTTYNLTPNAAYPYLYELPPTVEMCSSMAFTFRDSFPRGWSGGFTLEMLSFYVALEKGLNKLPIAVRIKPSATTYPVPTPTGGIFVITVDTVAALSAYVVTGLTSGNWVAVVRGTGRLYRLDANSGLGADGISVITASDGRQWFII